MSWFSRKSKPEPPKPAEPQDEAVTLALKCMKCESRYEVTFQRNVVRTAPGLCPCCQKVVEWMVLPQQVDYLEFLRIEAAATRRYWIVR